jgi:hypothetical protein
VLIGWRNLADAAAVSASSDLVSLPAANVQHPQLSRVWATAPATSAWLLLDMHVPATCSLLALIGTNLTPDATLRVRASDADPTAAAGDLLDTGAVNASIKAGYGAAYRSFAPVAARYWRLDLADASVSDIRVGRVFLGPAWDATGNLLWDYSVTPVDESQRAKSYGGQSHTERRARFRVLAFTLDYMSAPQAWEHAFALQRECGLDTDILAIPDIASPYLSEQAVWGLMTASEPVRHRALPIHTQKFSVEERI